MSYLSRYLLFFWMLLIAMLLGICIWGELYPSNLRYAQEKSIARKLLLTDLCLSTESRHTRHLSTPEIIAPFQDLPGYHEHFPSSSFFQVELQPISDE